MPKVEARGEKWWNIVPLQKGHDRHNFSCGVEPLDRYIQKQASQDARRHIAAPFVLVKGDDAMVAGYYTLSQASILLRELPAGIVDKLPGYPAVPATLLGRLAVDSRYRRQGLGEFLLMDALNRSWRLSDQIASFAVIVDAKDEPAQKFYMRYDFRVLPDQPSTLFLPMAALAKLFRQGRG